MFNDDYSSYIKNFFDLVDLYLIKDLETLINEIPPRAEGGGVGYPALHTLLSGMELLGLVLSGKEGYNAFEYYWNNYLVKTDPRYSDKGLLEIFRRVMRGGTAHFFLVKTGVSVSKGRLPHLSSLNINSRIFLNIDLKELHSHFIQTYQIIKNSFNSSQITPEIKKGCDLLQRQMNDADKLVQSYLETRQSVGGDTSPTHTSTSASVTGISGLTSRPPWWQSEL